MNKEINLRQQLINCGVSMDAVDKHIKKFLKDIYKKYDSQEADKVLQMNIAKQEIQLVAYITIVENFKAYSLLSAESCRRLTASLEKMFKEITDDNVEDVNKHLTNTSDRVRMAVEMSGNLEGENIPKLIDEYFDEKIKIYKLSKGK